MRIGITGDTHGSAQAIRRILQQTPPIELWLHTGDYAADANRLHDATGIKTVRVRGNCDLLDDGSKYDEYLEIEGYKIWLTHGHRYIERNVQADLGYWAKQLGQDIVVFGHTHVPMAEYYAETLLVNPGSPSRPAVVRSLALRCLHCRRGRRRRWNFSRCESLSKKILRSKQKSFDNSSK